MIRIHRALISVHDKTGLAELARKLHDIGVEILSTGGTAKAIAALGIPVRQVSDVTGHPEIFNGRVKTLHPKIHGGILFRRDDAGDAREAEEHGIGPIDLVVVSLYPFEQTVAREGVTQEEAVEQIDIGGPAMIRAAAKNHAHVVIVTHHSDYRRVLDELAREGCVSAAVARDLAARAFARTFAYDQAIAAWLSRRAEVLAPEHVEIEGSLRQPLRYGENPHQAANAYTVQGERGGVLQATVRQGKELSYNNIVDLDAAWCLVRDLARPGVAIIKHANPCGAAEGASLREALVSARCCDPVSAFGGVYAFNEAVDRVTAETLVADFFVECAIAPSWDAGALEVLAGKKNVRVLEGELPPERRDGKEWKRVTGGLLVQDWDDGPDDREAWRIVTKRTPTDREAAALAFAWRVTRHVKSNAIVFTAQDRTLAIGAGQSSRVDSVELCVLKAKKHGLSLAGSAVGSDAFFPFRDGVDAAAAAGATAVIQPGGSVRDDEVVAAADEHDMAMILTGRRHFRH